MYANLAWSRGMGKNIVSAQFNFGPDELAFIANNFIHLDHDQTWSGSAGIAYTLNSESDHPTRFSVDALVQSGLRASTPTVPNGVALPDLRRGEPVGGAETCREGRNCGWTC